jgi:hypothetical protein
VRGLADQISDHPMLLPLLEVIDSEGGNLSPAQAATEHQCQHRPVAAALRSLGVGSPQQSTALFRRQPVPERTPTRLAPFTRRMPAASSGQRSPVSAAS